MKFFGAMNKIRKPKAVLKRAVPFFCIAAVLANSVLVAEATRETDAIGNNYKTYDSTYETSNSQFYYKAKGTLNSSGYLKSLDQTVYNGASNKTYSWNCGSKTQSVKLVDDILNTNFSLASQYTFYVKDGGYTGTTVVDTNTYPYAKSYHKWQNGTMSKTDATAWEDSDGHTLAKGYKLTADNEGSLATNSPYCIYKNAGLYTDANGISHQIDVKVELTRAAIASGEANGAGYFAFRKDKPGILTWQVSWCTVNYKFYEGGTAGTANEKAVNVTGHLTFKDIDASQGVAFHDSGFDNFYVYGDNNTKALVKELSDYYKAMSDAQEGDTIGTGISKPAFGDVGKLLPVTYDSGSSKFLYVYDLTGKATSESNRYHYTTWVTATFTDQNKLTVRFTGEKYESEHTYAKSDSDKNMYTTIAWWWAEATKLTTSVPQAPHKSVNKSVVKNKEEFAYTLRHYVPIEDVTTGTNYTGYTFTDKIPSYFTIKNVRITNEAGADASGFFTVNNASNNLTISATAAALSNQAFYGHNYNFVITCQLADGQLLPAIMASTGNGIPNTGYLTITNKSGALFTNKATETVYVKVVGEANITVKKQGALHDELLKDATFKIQQWNGTGYEDMDHSITTDANGQAVTKPLSITAANQGKFRVVETVPPEGYDLLEGVNAWEVSLADGLNKTLGPLVNSNEEIPYAFLNIKKVDKDTGNVISGAEFTIYEWDATKGDYKTEPFEVMIDAHDLNPGLYINQNALTYIQGSNDGKFKVVETKAPAGYYYNEETPWEQEFNVIDLPEEAVLEFTCENELIKGIVSIDKKTDEESGEALEHAEFDIIAAEDIKAPDGTPLVAKGEVVDTIRTDAEGKASSRELFLGSYKVVESKAPAEYFLSDREYPVTFTYPEETEHPKNLTIAVQAEDRRMHPSVAVAKLAPKTTGVELVDGRYRGEKEDGQYEPNEVIDYVITVTNTGDVDLKRVVVTDTMSSGLKAAIDGEAGFLCDTSITSTNGEQVPVSKKDYEASSISGNSIGSNKTVSGNDITRSEEDAYVVLENLRAGDSVQLTYRVTVGADTAMAYKEDNVAAITEATYFNNEEDRDVPKTDQMEDHDTINIPGTVKVDVSKLADKTTGLTLVDGQYEGSRIIGSYKAGDTITYTITVKNSGTTDLYDLTVEDVPSEELLAVLEEGSIAFQLPQDGIVESSQGVRTAIRKETDTKLSFAHLAAGDSLAFTLTGKVVADITDKNQLKNQVVVNAYYFDGNSYVPIPPADDEELVSIPGDPSIKAAKLADKTTGVTFQDGKYQGTKVAGTYAPGEAVDFSITATNAGKTCLYNIEIVDTMSDGLKGALEKGAGFDVEEGTVKTDKGNDVKVTKKGSTVLLLDQLEIGDSITFHFKGTIKKDIGNVLDAENVVTMTAEYNDGNTITKVVDKDSDSTDRDSINIPGKGKISIKKVAAASVRPGANLEYTISKVRNESDSKVKNFTVTDTLPKKTALVSLSTGTYNQNVKISVYYKTNLSSDLKLWKKGIKGNRNTDLLVSELNLKEKEYVTSFTIDYGTVKAGFQEKSKPAYIVKVSSSVEDRSSLVNRIMATGEYFGKKLEDSCETSTTVDRQSETPAPVIPVQKTPASIIPLPKTGDTANLIGWIVLVAVCIIVIVLLCIHESKKHKMKKADGAGKAAGKSRKKGK